MNRAVLVVDADEEVREEGGWSVAAGDEAVVVGAEAGLGEVGEDVGLEVGCEGGEWG